MLIIVLGRTCQGLLHDSFDHLLVAFDLELAVGDAIHILHHLLLRLHHELLTLYRVHLAHSVVLLLVLLHSALQRRQVVVDHQSIHWELLLCLQFEDSKDGEIKSHSSHQSFDHVDKDLDEFYLIDQDAFLLRSVNVRAKLADIELCALIRAPQISHVLLQR